MNKSDQFPRVSIALRKDLADRAYAAAAMSLQNPNYFLNSCIEGCLDAMESEDIAVDIPIVIVVRKICGQPILAAKRVSELCAIFSPPSIELTPHHYQIFTNFLNNHEGELTHKAIRLYSRLADNDYHQQLAFEAEVAALRDRLATESEVKAKVE